MVNFYDEDALTPAQARALQLGLQQPNQQPLRTKATRGKNNPALAELDPRCDLSALDVGQTNPNHPTDATPTVADPYNLLAENDDRALQLHRFQPKTTSPRVSAVQPAVVEMVARIAFLSELSDRTMMTIGFPFALWCHRTFGTFDLNTHLSEENRERYLREAVRTSASKASARAALERFARGRRAPRGIPRPLASPPYGSTELGILNDIATYVREPYNEPVQMLLHLSLNCGLTAEESQRAKTYWITQEGQRTHLLVPNKNSVVREVPVIGSARTWLNNWMRNHDDDDYLLRPSYSSRRNTISQLVTVVAKQHPQFNTYDSYRARHTWLLKLLTSPMPFTEVCQIAGIGHQSHLPTDLTPYFTPKTTSALTDSLAEALHKGEN